jgi:membrane-associated protease RseP (regulator of RpoE activity)
MDPLPIPRPSAIHVGLFVLTLLTTTMAGAQVTPEFRAIPLDELNWRTLFRLDILVHGLPFSLSLLGILGIHEMGHFVASRAWRVRATLPYFIPFPLSMIGTLGAVIRIRSRIPNRRALIDIGAAGPVAGFVVAVAALSYGLAHAQIVSVADFEGGSAIVFGDSLLTSWLQSWIVGPLPLGHDVMLHPVGFAGWLGLFVTVLNLLPVGQFDGGHIVYAALGRKSNHVSRATVIGLILFWAAGPDYVWMGSETPLSDWLTTRWPGWLVWAVLALLLGRRHPSPVDPYTTLDVPRKCLGILSVIIFILCFIPRPIYFLDP